MYINLDTKEYNLADFLANENVSQGEVRLESDYSNAKRSYFLYKLKGNNDTTAVMLHWMFYREAKISTINEYYRFLVLIDYNNKVAIYDDSHSLSYNDLCDALSEFKIYSVKNLALDLNTEYKNKYNDLMDTSFEKFMEIPDYSKNYKETSNSYRREVEDYLLSNKKIHALYVAPIRELESTDLDFLHHCIVHKDTISMQAYNAYIDTVNNKANCNWITNHSGRMARIHLMEDIKNSPSYRVRYILALINAIEPAGKTLNLILKDGSECKVKNQLIQFTEFKTCTGRNYIDILEIDKITFNKKVIFEATTII